MVRHFPLYFLMVFLIFGLAACSQQRMDDEAITVDSEFTNDDFFQDEFGTRSNVPEIIPGSLEDLTQNVGDRIFFGYDSSELNSSARQTLNKQAEWLQSYPTISVTIEGHADERGTREYNLALGERRASAVRNYLIALGVSGSRLSTISYGKERPVVLLSTPEGWAQNRRAVTTIN